MMKWRGYREEARLLLVVYSVVGLLLLLGSCVQSVRETKPAPAHPTHWAVGGPGWRVMDVKETTDAESLEFIEGVAEEVAECLGRDVDLDGWRIFGFNVLMYQKVHGETWSWEHAYGAARPVEKWLYVKAESRRRSADAVMGTLKHELVHVGMHSEGAGHPEVDPLIGKCAGMHEGQRRYRLAWARSQR